MKKATRALAVSVCTVLAVGALAACGGGNNEVAQITATARICYDNITDDISVPESATKLTVEGGASKIKARGGAKLNEVAEYDSKTQTFTAKGKGSLTYETKDGETVLLEVVPAYVTDPGDEYRYTGNSMKDVVEDGESELLGGTHDPSLIEVIENNRPVWYIVSTGWATVSDKDGETWGNPIYRSTDLINWTLQGRTFDHELRGEEFDDTMAGKWLYDGVTNGYSSKDASWWAPDVVKCPFGGYWLYTCVVDGAGDSEGMGIDGKSYARACILLYHSDTLEAGSFKPVLFPEGHADAGRPVVLMQSSIERGESVKDVNGIDPQIIYTPDGKMYMAYGSFGSGNYIIELDPATGLRKDGKGWQTHDQIRGYVENDIQDLYKAERVGWTHDYYGTNISKANMEAPVIARHDNVTIMDENGEELEGSGETYYYSMHSYNGLGDDYQMWGGRSGSVTGTYVSATGAGVVYNVGSANSANEGNKYMGAFKWEGKDPKNKEIDVILTGHNDLFTTGNGTSVAAYITRTPSYGQSAAANTFCVQIHQYYLNGMGQIVINPNRYAGEISRAVTEEELLAYTEEGTGGYKFKMVAYGNTKDTTGSDKVDNVNVSRDVILTADHTVKEADGTALGTWKMYGNGYIKFTFSSALKGTGSVNSEETVYYGVVRPAWLGDQQRSGFTISCLGQTGTNKRSMTMFMNNYSNLEGSKFLYEFE